MRSKSDPHSCEGCGEWVHPKRWALGYHICRACGEAAARRARASWAAAPAGHKQAATLRGLNKNNHGD